MDTRIALKKNTVLRFCDNGNSSPSFVIRNELARGGSCIVYDATYQNNSGKSRTVRIKECYPFKLSLTRSENGELIASASDEASFITAKRKMHRAFDLNNDLFETSTLTNFTSNTLDIYETNNTVYIVSTYQEGKTLSLDTFSSLKYYTSVVKSVALAVSKLHKKGFLYLDIKPENVLILNGTIELIQLFDFDTLVPIDESGHIHPKDDSRISFTKGFAAPEQQMQQYHKIGKQTDIFSIGALLFYLIFGRTPNASYCRDDSVFDYENSKLDTKIYRDKLFTVLTDFFHNTLANYYLDRYQEMTPVLEKLDEIIKLSDAALPYVFSTQVVFPALLLGRARELNKMNEILSKKNSLFITGMGGIGKSTLVRSYLASNIQDFDNVLYLYYSGSVRDMLNDDKAVHINTIEREKSEKLDEYFYRKFRYLKELFRTTNSVIVIDDFSGKIDSDLIALLNIGCKVIVVSRSAVPSCDFSEITINPITEKRDLYTLFARYSQLELSKKDTEYLDKIIEAVGGHTLVLELIAKQIKRSHLTLQSAYLLLQDNGFSSIAPEKVLYEKDMNTNSKTIQEIIGTVFSAKMHSAENKTILKVLSLFSIPGINIHLLKTMLNLSSLDFVNELINEGWINIERYNIYLHPVIRETILLWNWSAEYVAVALNVMNFLCSNFDYHLAESVLVASKGVSILQSSNNYNNLLFQTIIKTPREREDFILARAFEYLTNSVNADIYSAMQLYDLIVFIYSERRDFEKVLDILSTVKARNEKADSFEKAQYYSLLADFYDARLDGDYSTDNEYSDLKNLLKALDKAIHYAKQSDHSDSLKLMAKYTMSKANVLMRSKPKKIKSIKRLIEDAKELIEANTFDDKDLMLYYNMSCGWYFTLVVPSVSTMIDFVCKADGISKSTAVSELDRIDNVLIPFANMLFELGEVESAEEQLYIAIHICEKYKSMPYMRKKADLYECLLDIYGDNESLMDQRNRVIETLKLLKSQENENDSN